ncbi:hypothetical protein GF371_03400 [Candidatus Woesearchaeota archaeon]|nr:hypothetical protein [Candidatus Woesearchaeota archaeon]
MIDTVIEYLTLVWKIFSTPWTSLETLWLVLPLVLILILIHLYFGRFRSEELGWNSAFGNSISLLWICVILFRFLFDKYSFFTLIRETQAIDNLIIVLALTAWVILLLAFNYFHAVPKKLAFALSSADSTYILAYIIISVIIGGFSMSIETLIASAILFAAVFAALELFKHLIPMTGSAKEAIKRREKKKKAKSKK